MVRLVFEPGEGYVTGSVSGEDYLSDVDVLPMAQWIPTWARVTYQTSEVLAMAKWIRTVRAPSRSSTWL